MNTFTKLTFVSVSCYPTPSYFFSKRVLSRRNHTTIFWDNLLNIDPWINEPKATSIRTRQQFGHPSDIELSCVYQKSVCGVYRREEIKMKPDITMQYETSIESALFVINRTKIVKM